jgi:hypothetical protein
METAARRLPKSVAMTEDLINRHAWLADAYNANKDRDGERRHRRLQERLLLDLMRADPKNMKMKSKWISAQRSLAGMEADEGETDKALERLHKALIVSDQMIAFDPENKAWVLQRKKVEGDISHISHANAGK